jgi:CDP-diacylglycerol--serine O-phosphatidyltransferase
MGSNYEVDGFIIAVPAAILALFVAGLMVSTILYSSFKTIDFKGRVSFLTIVLAVFLISAVALEPAEMLFAIFFFYIISGPLLTLWQVRKMKKQRSMSALRQVGRKSSE